MIKIILDLHNDTSRSIHVVLELAGWTFVLEPAQLATVTSEYKKTPITIRLSDHPEGDIYVQLYPGDGKVIVESNGQIVLEG